MKNFVYIHIEKLKEWGRGKLGTRQYRQNQYKRNWGVQGCWEHDMRLIETDNADAKQFSKNEIACAETGWKLEFLADQTISKTGCNSPTFIVQKAQELLRKHEIKPRDDQVKVAMLLQAVSPEFLRDGNLDGSLNPVKVRKWKKATLSFLVKKYGDSLLSVIFHDDEMNPHATAYVLPLIEKEVRQRGRRKKNEKDVPKKTAKKWCLSCADLFTPDPFVLEKGEDGKIKKKTTGKGTCSLLQDEYAEMLQSEGLEIRRGVRRKPFQRGLQNESNRVRYERLYSPPADVETLDETTLKRWAVDAAVHAEESYRTRIERDHYQVAAADSQEKLLEFEKKITESQRALPVEDVIAALTGMDLRTPGDNKGEGILSEFLLPNGQRIGILEGNRFQNLTPEIPFPGKNAKRLSGRGAIDAVTFVTGWSSIEAMEWIVRGAALDYS